MLNKSWKCVTETTIKNSFRHAGLCDGELDEEDDVPLSEWLKMNKIENDQINSKYGIDFYDSVEENLTTSELPSDNDIVDAVLKPFAESDSDETEADEEPEHIFSKQLKL